MFDGISIDRLGALTQQERRWLENIKKAIHDSDRALLGSEPQDHCLEELCKAVDTAKTLRRALRGEDTFHSRNRERFIEFLDTELPGPENRGLHLRLVDPRTGKAVTYSFSEAVYAIRCMVHENENLNIAEQPNYHIQLDWRMSENDMTMGYVLNGVAVFNARFVCSRVRQILSKFVTGLESMVAFSQGADSGCITGSPPLGSIRPRTRS